MHRAHLGASSSSPAALGKTERVWWARMLEKLTPDLVIATARKSDLLAPYLAAGMDDRALPDEVRLYRKRNQMHLVRGLTNLVIASELRIPTFFGALGLRVTRGFAATFPHLVTPLNKGWVTLDDYEWGQLGLPSLDFGIVSMRVVTTAGVNHIRDSFRNTVELELMNYHGIGTGNTAEAIGDTALVTESTTALNPDSTRGTGTQSANGNGVYRTIGTLTADGSIAAVEHGIFSQAATGGGVLLDRSVFSTVNLAALDSLQATYDHTQTAGS
jgi:hypothetical protein